MGVLNEKRCKKSTEKMNAMKSEIDELKTQLSDREEYIDDLEKDKKVGAETIDLLNKKIQDYKKTNEVLLDKYNKTDAVLKQFMSIYEYEISCAPIYS
jgi:predicted  nucleic acid-binding Zn-ribbon protein